MNWARKRLVHCNYWFIEGNLEDGALLMQLFDGHCSSVMLNAAEPEQIAETPAKISIV